jgi:bacillithiol system protein YtxJ
MVKIYFKHSTRCPISAGAKIEMDSFLRHNDKDGDLNYEYELIDVIGNRERSNEIAQSFGIEHESPQIIITDNNNKVIWHASHRAITEESIKKAFQI